MPLTKITFQPGINRESSQYATGPGWYDCDKVRFRMGRPEQVGGWVKYSQSSYLGIARSLFDWGTTAAEKYLGIGTNLKFYVENGGTLSDVTPLRETTAAGDVTFAAVNGDNTITIADTSHGAVMGDYVTFSGSASLGGVITAAVLNIEYEITVVIDADSYEVEAAVAANASDTGNGGAAVVGAYQINTGTNNYVSAVGYGAGTYGAGTYGGGGGLAFAGQLRLYSQDTFGDDLVFCPRAGGVYFWDESSGTGTRAIPLSGLGTASNTPTVALQVMVSPVDRHVICFGVNTLGSATIDPLLVRWSDQEDAGDWTPTAINSAGGQVLSTGNSITGAVKTRQEILIFTDTSVTSMRFAGAPFVYTFSIVGENISIIGPNAAVAVGDMVFFMDTEGFYVYQGAISRIPCTVLEHVFTNLDKSEAYKIFAVHNIDDTEVTWHYPAGGTGVDNTNYVTYDYTEQVWTIGTFARGAWIQAASKTFPIASSNDTSNVKVNYLYNQEVGYDADGSNIGAYLESGDVELGDGDSLMFMRRFLADFKIIGNENSADFTVNIKGRDHPMEDLSTRATKTVLATTKQSHVRVRAREVTLRIASQGNGYGWTMGDFRFDLRTDGRR